MNVGSFFELGVQAARGPLELTIPVHFPNGGPVKGLLVRIGVDQAYGGWNAPADPKSKQFVYVPIPETREVPFKPNCKRTFEEIMPALESFNRKTAARINLPQPLRRRSMHLDPDFEHLTYGDNGVARGKPLRSLEKGDFLAFYGSLKPIHRTKDRLVYALLGLLYVAEVVEADSVEPERWHENAHTRKAIRGTSDLVVRGVPEGSGRLKTYIPIGEWRRNAYRVTENLLSEWGGLGVKDGYIQRSANLPPFAKPNKFLAWFREQRPVLLNRNN